MSLFKRLFIAIRSGAATDQDWDEIRAQLLGADLGIKLTDLVISQARSTKPADAQIAIEQLVMGWLGQKNRELENQPGRLKTILLVGVNGTGKTTSTAKLANLIKSKGQTVLLAAADTFRAAAIDQIQTWAQRIAVEIVSGLTNSDPAAIAFQAVTKAKAENFDYLIIDTAGRLHNNQNLMDELGKITRVIIKQTPIDEILLVLDATTGQNGLMQAKVFTEAVKVSGFIVTKLDGSAKGGIALAIEKETGLPIKFVTTGEQILDITPFNPAAYVQALFT